MDYASIDNAEKGETANLASGAASPRKTMLAFGVAVTMAAISGFAVGAKTMAPSPQTSAFAAVASSTDYDKAYIINDCYGDKHVEYTHKTDPFKRGWRCVKDEDGSLVLWSNYYKGAIGEYSLYGTYQGFVVLGQQHPFDDAAIAEPNGSPSFCDRAAFDTNYVQWRCLAEDDFYASSLSAWDLASQANAAGTVVYASSKHDLYEDGGWFYYDWSSDSMKWNSVWGGTDEVEYTWSLIDDTNYKLHKKTAAKIGWYRVVKECNPQINDESTFCWLTFYCTDPDNTDELSDDC